MISYRFIKYSACRVKLRRPAKHLFCRFSIFLTWRIVQFTQNDLIDTLRTSDDVTGYGHGKGRADITDGASLDQLQQVLMVVCRTNECSRTELAHHPSCAGGEEWHGRQPVLFTRSANWDLNEQNRGERWAA